MSTFLPPNEHYARLHKIPTVAGALIRNASAELLIVKPNYRDGWLIPGGAAEADESPKTACYREVLEEVGLELPLGRLLCVDYRFLSKRGGSLAFLFDGGVLNNTQIESIRLQTEELDAFKFVDKQEALKLCNTFLSTRMKKGVEALETNKTFYLENQLEV